MYNVKVLKYPTGWQYRLYSDIVGYHGTDYVPDYDNGLEDVFVWNKDIEDYEQIRCHPDRMWTNIFTGEYETAPKLIEEPDHERSVKSSMARTVNKVYHLARSNVWDWFFTLTFNPDKVDSFDYEQCVKTLSKWLNNLRRLCPDLKYLVVPELHKSGRFHFHGLFAGCENITFTESGHFTKDGDMIYNIGSYRLGFSTATRVKENERVVKYLTKYITKELCNVASGRKRYWASRNLNDVKAVEVVLTPEEMGELLLYLDENCQYQKQIDGYVSTTYFEMGVNNENES